MEITPGKNELELELGALDPSRYLLVRCRTSSGKPVQDIWAFGLLIQSKGSSLGASVLVDDRPGGEYWISLERAQHVGDRVRISEVESVELSAESPSFGRITKTITGSDRVVEFVFDDPARLTVRVAGNLRPDLVVRLQRRGSAGESSSTESRSSSILEATRLR